MKTSKQELLELLQEYKNKPDSNHFIPRMFRCSLDGSYTSQEDNENLHFHIKEVLNIKTEKRKRIGLRSIAITRFTKFIELEFQLNQYYTLKVLREVFETLENLEQFNQMLIDSLISEVTE